MQYAKIITTNAIHLMYLLLFNCNTVFASGPPLCMVGQSEVDLGLERTKLLWLMASE